VLFCMILRRTPTSTLFPYTTLFRSGLGLAEVVVLKIAVAILVQQPAPFGASGLGDEDAGEGKSGRMVLHELHVLQRDAGAISQRSEEHTSELQSRSDLVCRLLLEKK